MRGAVASLRLVAALCATATALFVHPGAGNTATLKPPVIDPFNPFGGPAEDPMHGHEIAASHLPTDHLDVLARLASKLKHMRLEDIEQVVVIGLSDHDLELQVMTCEDEECVSVLVPVEFIAPCCQADEEGYEEEAVVQRGGGGGRAGVVGETSTTYEYLPPPPGASTYTQSEAGGSSTAWSACQ